MSIIEAENIHKNFKVRTTQKGLKGGVKGLFKNEHKIIQAVNDVSFDIDKGEIIGYIGANGAGKSTTIKMMTGILVPTSGIIRVSDIIPHKNRKKNAKHIGVVFGQRSQLMWDLPLEESFDLQRHIFDVSENDNKKRMSKFKQIFNLGDFLQNPVRKLSLGQRMRGEVCLSLIHNPDIVYLDEPTIGLDVISKEAIRNLIIDMNKEYGTTFFVTTHDMNDIESVCKRVMIIDKGQLIYDGSIGKLKTQYGDGKSITIHLDYKVQEPYDKYQVDGLSIEKVVDEKITYRLLKDAKIDEIVASLFSILPIKDISMVDDNIEDVVKKIYR